MQYILVKREQADDRYHETMPDGRVILPITDIRSIGSLTDVDIIGSARELKALIAAQKEEIVKPESGGTEEVDPGMQVTPEGTEQPETGEETEGTETGKEETGTEESGNGEETAGEKEETKEGGKQ